MSTDYAKISAENVEEYGRGVKRFGSAFADHYTERTHLIFELLQNAEDALCWRDEAEPGHRFPRSVKFALFPDHLEVTHYGLPFNEKHVRAICSIMLGTKSQNLTNIGKFGIGFKSVYAYTKRPEVHSDDEHFVIESYVHPRSVSARDTQSGQTLFYIPFDHDEIPAEQAHAEISARLPKLGFRTLLFLNQIIRQHREEFEKLKRSVKEKPPTNAKPVEPPSPTTPAPSSTESQNGEPPPHHSAAVPTPEAASGEQAPTGAPGEAPPASVPSVPSAPAGTQPAGQQGPGTPATPQDAVA